MDSWKRKPTTVFLMRHFLVRIFQTIWTNGQLEAQARQETEKTKNNVPGCFQPFWGQIRAPRIEISRNKSIGGLRFQLSNSPNCSKKYAPKKASSTKQGVAPREARPSVDFSLVCYTLSLILDVTMLYRKSYLPRVTPKLMQNAAKRPHQQNRAWRRASRGANPCFCQPFCCILR